MSILLAPLTIAGVAGVLAALIAIVDGVVNNYGEVTLDINNGKKEVLVKGGAPLLMTLSSEGLYLPSACGGRGSCGACKCEVATDIGPLLPTETPWLTPEEQKQGNIRLACQVKVKTDLGLQIPEDLFNVKQFASKVLSIKDVTYDIKEVVFDLGEETIDFAAGKYIQLVIPPHGKIKSSTQRAYSLSSDPKDKHRVETLVRLVPGGLATGYVHNHLQVGQKLDLVGPFGDFKRSETEDLMLWVAGGSGMAPFKSFAAEMQNLGISREIWYFFGARTTADMFYMDKMHKLEEEWPNFHFVPALSEPQEGDGWTGPTGLITDVLDTYIKEKIDPSKPKEGYLCGSPGMIDACIRVMNQNGITQEKIYYDKFA